METNKKKRSVFRAVVQIVTIIIVFCVSISKFAGSGVMPAFLTKISFHTICPFGGVETLYQLISAGTYIQKIHSSALVLLITVSIGSLLFGAVFCGWFCPFGSYQEFVGKLGKKIFKKKYNTFVPSKIDGVLRYLRYVILALVIINTAKTAKLLFADVDPYYALFNFFTGEVAISAFVVLGIFTVLALFVERPWCKYACPYGAIQGLTNMFSIFKIRRNAKTCIDCKACSKICPMNIDVSTKDPVINHQCVRCYECLSEKACPVADTVTIATKKPV